MAKVRRHTRWNEHLMQLHNTPTPPPTARTEEHSSISASFSYLAQLGAQFVLVRNDGTPESKRPRQGITWGSTWPSGADMVTETATTDGEAHLPVGLVPGSIGLAVLDVDNDADTKDFPSKESVEALILRFPPAAVLRSLSGKPHLYYHDLAPLQQRHGQQFRVGSPFILDGLSGEVRGSRTFAIVTDIVSLVAQLRAVHGLRDFRPVAAACRRADGGYVFPEEAVAQGDGPVSGLSEPEPSHIFGSDRSDSITTPSTSQALRSRGHSSLEQEKGIEDQKTGSTENTVDPYDRGGGRQGGSSVDRTTPAEDREFRRLFLGDQWYVPRMSEGGRHVGMMKVLGSVWAQPSVSGQGRPLLAFARWMNRSACLPPLPDADVRQMVQTIVQNAEATPEEQHRLFLNRERIRGRVSGMRSRMLAYAKAKRPRLLFIERGRVSPAASRKEIQQTHGLSRSTIYHYTAGGGPSARSFMLKADRETALQLNALGISPEKMVAIRRKKVKALQAEGFDVDGLAWSIGDVAKLLALPEATGGPTAPPSRPPCPQHQVKPAQGAVRPSSSRAPPRERRTDTDELCEH